MSTTYFLVFLLGLVVLSTPTTAEQNGGAALDEPRQMPFMSRFHSRGWARIRNHPSKSIEKSLERAPEDVAMQQAKLKLTGARRTMQKVEEKAPEDHTSSYLPGAKPATQNMEKLHRDKPESFLPGAKKTTMYKLEEAPKDMPTGYRAKMTNTHKVEDMHL